MGVPLSIDCRASLHFQLDKLMHSAQLLFWVIYQTPHLLLCFYSVWGLGLGSRFNTEMDFLLLRAVGLFVILLEIRNEFFF